jgi:hypothetical protein
MTFLFPTMLAGLIGLGVPIALHLIAKHKFPILDFPTLRLLTRDQRTNQFAMKLIDPLQLLLRLLTLALLVLAMARLFSPADPAPAPRNLVVVLDASASMNQTVFNPEGEARIPILDLAIRKARDLLGEIRPPSQSAVVVAGDTTRVLAELQPGNAAALASVAAEGPDKLRASDGTGEGLVHAIVAAANLVQGRREVKSQIVVFSDLRATALATRNQKDLEKLLRTKSSLGDKLEVVFVDLASAAAENVAITDTHVRGGTVKVGDDAHVIATILNSGTAPKTAKLQLAVGNQPDPAVTQVALEPGGRAIVDLTTPVNRAVRAVADVRIKEPDSLVTDDVSSVPLNVAESRRVLIVNGAGQAAAVDQALAGLGQTAAEEAEESGESTVDGATILRYVLNPGREMGRGNGTGIDTTVVASDAIASQTLSKFELIVLYDVSSLPGKAVEDLRTFVRDGRSLLIVCSAGASALQFNRNFFGADPRNPGLAPAQLGNDQDLSPALALSAPRSAHPWLAPYRDPLQGDLSSIQFTKIRELSAVNEAAAVVLAAPDGRPLAVDMPLGRGRVMMLAFGFELNRGTLGRTRVFPTLMWRLVDYLTGRLRVLPPDSLVALTPAALDVSEPGFAFATELALTRPEGDPLRLPVTERQTVLIPPLPAGNYQLHKPRVAGAAGGHTRNIIVHPDPRESEMARAEAGQLAEWLGCPVQVIEPEQTASLGVTGREFRGLLVWLLLAAFVAEALTGYLLNARREKNRAREANA